MKFVSRSYRKMDVETVNPNTIRKLGLEALAKALGPAGMVRFLQQFEIGAGIIPRKEHYD